MLLKVKVYFG